MKKIFNYVFVLQLIFAGGVHAAWEDVHELLAPHSWTTPIFWPVDPTTKWQIAGNYSSLDGSVDFQIDESLSISDLDLKPKLRYMTQSSKEAYVHPSRISPIQFKKGNWYEFKDYEKRGESMYVFFANGTFKANIAMNNHITGQEEAEKMEIAVKFAMFKTTKEEYTVMIYSPGFILYDSRNNRLVVGDIRYGKQQQFTKKLSK